MNGNNNAHRNASCWKGYVKDSTVCEKREKNYVKPILYYFFHILLPLPVIGLVELDLNPLNWSVYTHLIGAIWVLYATKKLFQVLAR